MTSSSPSSSTSSPSSSSSSSSSSVFDFSSLEFDLSGSALTYRYEIKHATGEKDGTIISGLLGSDFSDSSSSSINFDNDIDIGGSAKYDISFYVSVNDFSGSSAIDLETIDVTFDLSGSELLDFSGSTADFSGSAFNYARSANIDSSDNTVRFTGAVGSELASTSKISSGGSANGYSLGTTSTTGGYELFTLKDVGINGDMSGSLFESIQFTNDTDLYDTTLSNVDYSGNTLIKSLDELSGSTSQDFYEDDKFSKVTVHEAQSNLVNVATNVYTQRFIGSSAKTNLIRNNNRDSGSSNKSLVAESYWINTGTFAEQLSDIKLTDDSSNSKVDLYQTFSSGISDFSGGILNTGWDVSGSYVSTDGSGSGTDVYELDGLDVSLSDISGSNLDASTMDGAKLVTNLYLDSSASLTTGSVTSLADGSGGLFQLVGEQSSDSYGFADKVSSNLITFQGDLNYDGRVSLTDLAFLNAGKIAADASGNFSDVDANFDGSITVADLGILSADWLSTIYDGSGSSFDSSGEATFGDFDSADSWITLSDSSGTSLINEGLSELSDFSGSVVDSSGSRDIFSTAVDFAYDNTSYKDGFDDKGSYDSVGVSLGSSPYDSLTLTS